MRKKLKKVSQELQSKKFVLNGVMLQAFVGKYHPDTVVANKAVNLFNDNVMSQFRKILKRRQKQQTLGKFLIKEKTKETQEKDLPEPKRQRIYETPLELPEVFMKKGFPI